MQTRNKANRKRAPSRSGVSHIARGTVKGRSRRKPPRKAPVRTKLQRQKRAERLLGFGGPILTP